MSRKTGNSKQTAPGMAAGELAARFDLALQQHRAGRLPKARQLYRKILKASPHHADALHMLGLLEHQAGDNAAAIKLFRQAAAAGPATAELHTNLGSALQASGDTGEAIAAYRRAIALNPRFALAHNNLGNALRAAGEPKAALDAFRQAIRIASDFALAHYNLGDLLHAQGRHEQAIESMRQALAIEPGFADACNSLATMLMEQGATDEARTLFKRTLQLDSSHSSARHMLAALEGQTTATAPSGYVVGLFDGCADYFERHLVDELGYRAPEDLYRAVSQLPGPGRQQLDVLDLGCGTGLCAPLFRGMARTLVGVDLSPGMLDVASQRKLYDRLVRGDITGELHDREDACDLILSADVFIYVGALEQVFEAVSKALRPGGLFAFSIESDQEGDGYVLRSSGRYAHSLAYIKRLAEAAGLREMRREESVLRTDKGQPVHGCIVVLENPGDA
jgi:predicted TPR repeat methyltransferase